MGLQNSFSIRVFYIEYFSSYGWLMFERLIGYGGYDQSVKVFLT